jgi:hypothetical protein
MDKGMYRPLIALSETQRTILSLAGLGVVFAFGMFCILLL